MVRGGSVLIDDGLLELTVEDITETDVIIIGDDNKPILQRVSEMAEIKPKKNEVVISFMKSNSHPNYGVMCFKISYKNKSIVYATDTECYSGGAKKLEFFSLFKNYFTIFISLLI